jgi:hypothetical protein
MPHQWQHHRYLLLHARQLQENFQRMQRTYRQSLRWPQLHHLDSSRSSRLALACFHSSTSKVPQECGLEPAAPGLCRFQLLQLELRWDKHKCSTVLTFMIIGNDETIENFGRMN